MTLCGSRVGCICWGILNLLLGEGNELRVGFHGGGFAGVTVVLLYELDVATGDHCAVLVVVVGLDVVVEGLQDLD
jgi:hypothetical protein